MDHICIRIKSSKEGKSTENGRGKYVNELKNTLRKKKVRVVVEFKKIFFLVDGYATFIGNL